MADAATTNAYLRTRVLTASPEELRLLLLEGALRFANQAKAGLESRDFEGAHAGFRQCRDIVLELLTTVKPEPDPELAERVRSLYTFMYSELVTASLEKDVEKLGKVIELLEYERETWVMLMDQLAKERGVSEPKPQAASPADGGERAPLSIQA
ncbi:MAG: flagellar export chaperone FliS [Phycisphaerales bacterium]